MMSYLLNNVWSFPTVMSVPTNTIKVFGDLHFNVKRERCHGFENNQEKNSRTYGEYATYFLFLKHIQEPAMR